MVAVPSTMLALGTPAPGFDLPDTVSGRRVSLSDFAGKRGLLVMFISRHCPYVQHVKNELAAIGRDYEHKDVGIVAICSNDVASHPDDAPDKLKTMAEESGLSFPICYDEAQMVAQAFTAACTPDFFLFDGGRKLAYRGQLDDSRPGNGKPVTGKDLRRALDALLAGKPVSRDQKASMGCNIKWKPGNEPPYFRSLHPAGA
jgi:peroxiredoxin